MTPEPNHNAPFDRTLLRLRRDRAAKRFAEFDFLTRRINQDFDERLSAINRQFRQRLSLGSQTNTVPEEFCVHGDFSETMIRELPAGHRLVFDEECLPFADESFDLVTATLTQHAINDLPGALIQIRQALKPDGLFLGALFGGETLKELRACLAEAEIELTGGLSPRLHPSAEVRDIGSLLQRAGFALPVTDSETYTVRYDNMFKLLADLRGMAETNVLTTRSLKPAPRALFLRAAELYNRAHADDDGRIRATFEVITATGWAPHASQQQPLRPGSAKVRLADALAVKEEKLT